MTPRLLFRPVLLSLAAASLSACGLVESDPHKFEAMADSVAAIPLDGAPRAEGLRPALEVEVLSPHALWDARDGDAGGDLSSSVQAAAPVVVR